MICGLGNCATRDAGGCYCLCRLKDGKSMLLSLLDGTSCRINGCVVYEPGRIRTPLGGFEKDNALKELASVREKIKTYELHE